MANKQDDKLFEEGNKIPLFEEFYTIQGEGFHSGKAAYFVRLGGCDLACNWCDTRPSWQFKRNNLITVQDQVAQIKKYPANAVVVTGGEPAIYRLDKFCDELHRNNIETFLETSGAYPITGEWDWVCMSPKRQRPPLDENYQKADEIKVVIDGHGFEWAEQNAAKAPANSKLFLQVEWSKKDELLPEIVEYVKQNPRWMISLQSHKYVGIP